MCEILVRAVDGIVPNPLYSKRGFLIVVMEDGHTWGDCECPPEYFILKVPGIPPESIRPKTCLWMRNIQFSVLSSVPATDTHTIQATATGFNSKGEGKITAGAVQGFLTSWGAKNIVGADNSVTFTVRILDAIQTSQFWNGLRVDDLFFTERSYTPATGSHRVEINYSLKVFGSPDERDRFIQVIKDSATFVSHNTAQKLVVLDVLRSTVQQRFMDDVKKRVERISVRGRRYRFPEALMVDIGAAGGVLTIDPARLNSSFVDAMTE